MSHGKIVIVGASGLVGFEAVRHFECLPGWEVVAISRRKPAGIGSAQHISVDLTDAKRCREVFSQLSDVTHVAYAAVHELPGNIVQGWQAKEQMDTNLTMIQNFFDPLEKAAAKLKHVTVLQGTKAYGVHIEPFPVPARERWPRHQHENFYWLQEDYIRERQQGKAWNWTILRPQLVFGEAIKGNLNALPAIAAHCCLEHEAGRSVGYTGGPPLLFEAVDTQLLARSMEWAANTPICGGEHFNICNGDVFTFENLWPTLCDALNVKMGPPKPISIGDTLPKRDAEWGALVDKYNLHAPRVMTDFIGGSAELADFSMAYGSSEPPPPVVVSTIKARQYGFHDCVDTEDMLRKWLARYQELRLLPTFES
jgi:nucleoside-diphosphate-sugar epimerase